MKTLAIRFVIVLALFFQVGWFLLPSLNILADPYRYDERQKAGVDWMREKTPETKAVFDQERRLLRAHLRTRAFVAFSIFLVVDGVGIYYFWNYGHKRKSV